MQLMCNVILQESNVLRTHQLRVIYLGVVEGESSIIGNGPPRAPPDEPPASEAGAARSASEAATSSSDW